MRERLPLILSTTALLVALFGATPLGEAAYKEVVPNNSIGAAQLRDGAVTSAKLRGDAVTSGKVRNHSLKAIDFAPGQIPAGPTGPAGPAGSAGAQGAPGLSGYQIVRAPVTVPAGGLAEAQAVCPAGEVAIGGAGFSQGVPAGVFIQTNVTTDSVGSYYSAFGLNTTTSPQNVTAVAVCATVTP